MNQIRITFDDEDLTIDWDDDRTAEQVAEDLRVAADLIGRHEPTQEGMIH